MDIFIAVMLTNIFWILLLLRARSKTMDGVINVISDNDALIYSLTIFDDPEEIQYNDRLVLKIRSSSVS